MVYRYIPFLYELNCLIDWAVTDTATDLYGYMRVEEIRNILFIDNHVKGFTGANWYARENRGYTYICPNKGGN